jgi:hypothetical protein
MADALIAEIDSKDSGKLTLKQFQELFFSSTEAFKLRTSLLRALLSLLSLTLLLALSTSMMVKEHRFRRRKPPEATPVPNAPAESTGSGEQGRRKWVVESRDDAVWHFDPAALFSLKTSIFLFINKNILK